MQAPFRSAKIYLATAVVLVLLHGGLILSSRLLPFTDLPNHLAAATIARHSGEEGNVLGEYFEVDLFPRPNVFHAAFCSLPIFRSVESANRAFYMLYLFLLPLSFLVLTRVLGGDPRYVPGCFLLAWSYGASWGFAGFTFAIPAVLLSAAASVRLARRAGAGHLAFSAFLLTALFFIHAQALLLALVLHAAALAFEKDASWRARTAGAAAALPAVVLLASWWLFGRNWWLGRPLLPYLGEYYGAGWLESVPSRWKVVFIDNYHLFEGSAGVAAGTAVTLVILAAAARPGRRAPVPPRAPRNLSSGGKRTAAAFLAAAAAACLFLPADIPGQSIVYQRFPVFLLLFLLLYGSVASGAAPEGRTAGRWRPAVLAAACLVHFTLWAGYFAGFNDENREFRPGFLPPGGEGRILAGLIFDHAYRGRPLYIHFPGYYTVWKKGVAVTGIVGYRFGPVRRAVDLTVLPEYLEWVGSHDRYDGRYAGLDYLLVRGEPKARATGALDGFRAASSAGEWRLLERAAE